MIHYRSHIALFLTAVISLNVLAVPISYLNFKVNQDYYATVLCENPQQPITVCGGVCYLKKQLPRPEQGEPVSFVSKIDITVFFQTVTAWSPAVTPLYTRSYRPYASGALTTYCPSLFRPPQV